MAELSKSAQERYERMDLSKVTSSEELRKSIDQANRDIGNPPEDVVKDDRSDDWSMDLVYSVEAMEFRLAELSS